MNLKGLEHSLMLDYVIYGNTIEAWLIALGIVLTIYVILSIAKPLVVKRMDALAKKTSTQIDDFIVELIASTKPFLLVLIAFWAGSAILVLPDNLRHLSQTLPTLALILQLALWGSRAVGFSLNRYAETRPTEEDRLATRTLIGPFRFLGLTVVWAVLLLVALDNVGIDVTAMITGLGIGGIAVALAVQNLLGDAFAAFSIVIDKPFVVGDFIIVDTLMGHVEHIGLKTTRIRSISGEQLVFSNSDLLGSRIRNYKRMDERRILFKVGVTYQTSADQLAAIPSIIQTIIDAQSKARFDRSHFSGFGDSSLDFETVYFVKQPDYRTYMELQQSINLAIFKAFEEQKIEFAYPTRTLFVTHENSAMADVTKLFKS